MNTKKKRVHAFAHLDRSRRAGTSAPVKVSCDYCDGTGQFGEDECPMCEGLGVIMARDVETQADDFVEQFKRAQDTVIGKRPPANAPKPPVSGSFAAKVFTAAKKARGDV